MRKVSRKQSAFLTAVIPAVLFFSVASIPECHAQSNCPDLAITSVTPSPWVAGQTYNVTITGTNFYFLGVFACPGKDYNSFQIYTLTESTTISQVNKVSPSEILATVTVLPTAPSETSGVTMVNMDYSGDSYPVQIIGISKNIGDPCCDGVGDPINVTSGNVFEQVTDYETTGQNKLSYIRYYNSLKVASTLATEFGPNYYSTAWRSNYDRFLQLTSSSVITVERPDGQEFNFNNTGGSWVPDSDVDYTLTQSGTTWTLTDHNDTAEVYSASSDGTAGLLQSITLRNGYAQTMAYNSNGQLATVTDS